MSKFSARIKNWLFDKLLLSLIILGFSLLSILKPDFAAMSFVLDDLIDRFWKDGRIKELEELARTEDFRFSMRDRLDLQTYKIKNFRLFQGRKAKRLRGIISKQVNSVQVRIYDYVYYAESHKKKTTGCEVFEDQLD